MRAQSQRKLIWILNALLGIGVLAVAAWIVVKVRPAVAAPDYLRPKWATAAERSFADQPPPSAGARLGSQVEEKELAEIDQPQFKTKRGRRYHWLYSGPMPPPPPQDAPVDEGPKAPVEDDLSKLGDVLTMVYISPAAGEEIASETIVLWQFRSGSRQAFVPGEFFEDPKASVPAAIKLVNVRPMTGRPGVYELTYEVYEDRTGEPLKRGTYEYDSAIELPPDMERLVTVTGGAGAGTGEGGRAEAEDATGPGTSAGGATPGVTVSGGDGATGTAPDLSKIEPIVVEEGLDRYRVEFDDATYDFVRQGDPERFAQSIKTQVAEDPQTGQPMGLRITGIDEGTPADRFDVKPGDVLVSINDRPVRSRSDAVNIAQTLPPDTDRVKVVIKRRDREITFNIDPRDPKTRRAARALEDGR